MDASGATLINIAKAEMGQHVGTALARVVTEELGADWDLVSIKHVDTDPKWGYMVTGGSWSVFTTFKMLSQAGAAGRIALLEAGSKLLNKPTDQCQALNGWVVCGAEKISYGQVIEAGNIDRTFSKEELDALPLKPAKERQLLGREGKAFDIPAKTDGSAKYGIDVELPGMVYSRPLLPPTRYGSSVISVDDSEAKKVDGYLGYEVLKDPSETLQGWVSVVAKTQWAALQSGDAIKVQWQAGPTAAVSENDLLTEGERLCKAPESGNLFVNEGDVDAAKKLAAHQIESTYRTASVLHFQLEPVNATVEYKDGIWHIHSGNQWQSLIMPVLSKALEVPQEKIIIHQYYLGGGFGRRLYGDYMIPALLTSKALGKPVKMVFSRSDDARMDSVRSPSVQQFTGCFDPQGQLTAVDHAAAAGWPTLTMAPGFMGPSTDGIKGVIDGFSINGADHWYTLANHRVRAINNELAQKTFQPGWLRSVGPGWIGWGVESFTDELAAHLNQDPMDFRIGLLDGAGKNAGSDPASVGGASRLAKVLERLKKQSDWGRELPADEGLGVACAFGQERTMPTWIAAVAHVAVDRSNGKVTVKKLHLCVDCGTVVHPDGALAQVQGSALWGLSLALHEHTTFEHGQVKDTNLDTYTPLRMADITELDIQFVDSQEFPMGLGEPGVITIAPAIGNAIYQAVGVRIRDLPISAKAIVEALSAQS